LTRAKPFADDAFLGQRQKAARGDDLVAPHNDRAVVQRRVGVENRLQDLGGDLSVDADARRGIVLQADLALERDKGSSLLRAKAFGGADRLRDGLAVEPRVVARERADLK